MRKAFHSLNMAYDDTFMGWQCCRSYRFSSEMNIEITLNRLFESVVLASFVMHKLVPLFFSLWLLSIYWSLNRIVGLLMPRSLSCPQPIVFRRQNSTTVQWTLNKTYPLYMRKGGPWTIYTLHNMLVQMDIYEYLYVEISNAVRFLYGKWWTQVAVVWALWCSQK